MNNSERITQIKILMAIHDITASALAKKIGISRNTLRYRLKGKSPFTVEELHKVEEVFNLPKGTLF